MSTTVSYTHLDVYKRQLLYCGIVAPRLLSKRDFVTAADTSSQSGKKASTLAAWQESLIYVAFVVNLLCMLFSDALPFSMNVVPVALDIILLYTKCLDLNDVKNFMNVDTLFMLVGVMCLCLLYTSRYVLA